MILVHGITETAPTWEPLIERPTSQRRVIVMDLRGHGRSGTAERYDLGEMAGDVVALASNLNVVRPHLVGHSLGGAVVSAVGAVLPVSSIINIDQLLQLDGFKEQLHEFEEQLRNPAAFPQVIQGLFEVMAGEKIDPDEMAQINAQRRPDQNVVLGVWDLILTSSVEEITAVVATALAGYRGKHVDYLTLFGIDPGPGDRGLACSRPLPAPGRAGPFRRTRREVLGLNPLGRRALRCRHGTSGRSRQTRRLALLAL